MNTETNSNEISSGKEPEDSGWRGSADVWLQASYETLIEAGIDTVRIQPLAKKLKLSRTSFYWFLRTGTSF